MNCSVEAEGCDLHNNQLKPGTVTFLASERETICLYNNYKDNIGYNYE